MISYQKLRRMGIPHRAVMWKRYANPDPIVFRIGCVLVAPEISTEIWKTIEQDLTTMLHKKTWEIRGGEREFNFQYLKPFMIGRLNRKRARILELCMYANTTKNPNYFRHALDIVEGIIELEECGMVLDEFAHNATPDSVLVQTVFP